MSQNNDLLNNQDCAALRELVPAYCIGATDVEETRLIEANLTRCPELAADIREYRRVAEALLFSAELIQPPPRVLERLMEATAPANPSLNPSPHAERDLNTALDFPRNVPARPRWASMLALAAALGVVLFATNLYWVGQVNNLEAERAQLSAQLQEDDDIFSMMETAQTRWLKLPAAQEVANQESSPHAWVVWSPEKQNGVLLSNQFPPQPENMAYQLWVRRGEEVISLGVFQVNEDGRLWFTFPAEGLVGQFDSVGITTEPASGSDVPTGNAVVRFAEGETTQH